MGDEWFRKARDEAAIANFLGIRGKYLKELLKFFGKGYNSVVYKFKRITEILEGSEDQVKNFYIFLMLLRLRLMNLIVFQKVIRHF